MSSPTTTAKSYLTTLPFSLEHLQSRAQSQAWPPSCSLLHTCRFPFFTATNCLLLSEWLDKWYLPALLHTNRHEHTKKNTTYFYIYCLIDKDNYVDWGKTNKGIKRQAYKRTTINIRGEVESWKTNKICWLTNQAPSTVDTVWMETLDYWENKTNELRWARCSRRHFFSYHNLDWVAPHLWAGGWCLWSVCFVL